jgi:hypothetical protein
MSQAWANELLLKVRKEPRNDPWRTWRISGHARQLYVVPAPPRPAGLQARLRRQAGGTVSRERGVLLE